MAYDIVFTDTAKKHYHKLKGRSRAIIKAGIEEHLRHQPEKVSKSRIKRLRGINHPGCRLRIDKYRIFYDIDNKIVVIIAIVPKAYSEAWLNEHGV